MSRALRIMFPNAWYHVMNRGAAHITTFHDNDDYERFLNLLLQTHRRYCFEIHAYCLMPNHYHILIRTPLANLSRGMRHLDSLYTQYYNKKYKRDGALFRGRYKSILVEAENYLLRLSRYIHLNPSKANLTKHPVKYPWSSYKFYSKNISPPDWLYTTEILSRFGIKQQKNKYSLFTMEKSDHEIEEFYRKTKLLPILGSDAFRDKISEKYLPGLKEHLDLKEIPDNKRVHTQPSLSHICETVAKYYHVPLTSLQTVDRIKGNLPRTIAIYLATEFSGREHKIIANFFKNINHRSIPHVICRVKKLKTSNPSLAKEIKNICDLI